METLSEPIETTFDVIESIRKHVEQLKPIIPKRGLVCIGDYPAKILLKNPSLIKAENVLPVFIEKSDEGPLKELNLVVTSQDIVAFDSEADTHFWFNVNEHLSKNEVLAKRLKEMTDSLHEAIVFVSLWEGVGSALLPILVSRFKSSNASSAALAVLPSKPQPSDAYFNTLASVGLCAANESAAIILVGRDNVENFVGVDRNGSRMRGNSVVNYLLDMMMAKETLTQELNELSRALNVKFYSPFCVTGASFKLYGSVQALLDAASLNSFLSFDLATASVLYLLVRVPLGLKDELSKGNIEMEAAKWSKRLPSVKSIQVSEPIYVDAASDRVDVIALAGNFDMAELTRFLQKKAGTVKADVVKKGLIKEEDWSAAVKGLTAEQ